MVLGGGNHGLPRPPPFNFLPDEGCKIKKVAGKLYLIVLRRYFFYKIQFEVDCSVGSSSKSMRGKKTAASLPLPPFPRPLLSPSGLIHYVGSKQHCYELATEEGLHLSNLYNLAGILTGGNTESGGLGEAEERWILAAAVARCGAAEHYHGRDRARAP